MSVVVFGEGSAPPAAVFPKDAAPQRHVLFHDTPVLVLCVEHAPPDHVRKGPRPCARVTVNLRVLVYTLVLVGLEVHLLAGAGHVELEVVLHHEGGVVMVAVQRRHHRRVVGKLVR